MHSTSLLEPAIKLYSFNIFQTDDDIRVQKLTQLNQFCLSHINQTYLLYKSCNTFLILLTILHHHISNCLTFYFSCNNFLVNFKTHTNYALKCSLKLFIKKCVSYFLYFYDICFIVISSLVQILFC